MISEIIFHNESNSIYHEILPANSQFSFGHHNSSDFSRDCIDDEIACTHTKAKFRHDSERNSLPID